MEHLPDDLTRADDGFSEDLFASLTEFGSYRIVQFLGRGGMGEVYHAEDVSTNRSVALKLLRHRYSGQRRFLQRFQREAQAVQVLQHEHIVPLFESGEEQGIPYLAMQLIEGQTLAEHITQVKGQPACTTVHDSPETGVGGSEPDLEGEAFSYVEIAKSIADIAEAVHAAHVGKIVHRDIKPSNLMLDRCGKLWLTDFGLASVGDEQTAITMTGDLLGTPAYMSPEQAGGSLTEVSRYTDVYSLGATLYEWATLQKPFSGNREQILFNVAQGNLTLPSKVRADIPRPLEAIICKAMSLLPEGRYITAEEFAKDLRLFAAGRTVSARLPGWTARLYRWSERNPLVALASLLGVAATVIAVLVMQAVYSGTLVAVNSRLEDSNKSLVVANKRLEVREQQLSQQLFVSDMSVAFKAYASHNFPTVQQLLQQHRPDPREHGAQHFAWGLLRRLTTPPESALLSQHDGVAAEVAVSRDGQLAVSVGHDGFAYVIDLENRRVLHKHEIGTSLDGIAISPDKKWFLTGNRSLSGFNGVSRRDMQTGEMILSLLGHANTVEATAVSPDGEWFATADRYRDVQVHDSEGRFVHRETTESRNESLMFLKDKRSLALLNREGHRNEIRVWDFVDKRYQQVKFQFTPNAFGSSLPLNSAGDLRLAASGEHQVAVVDWPSGRAVARQTKVDARVRCIDISADGTLVFAGTDDGLVYVWETEQVDSQGNFAEPVLFQASLGQVTGIRAIANPDSNTRFVTTSEDGKVQLWDVARSFPMRPSGEEVPYALTAVVGMHASSPGASKIYMRLENGFVASYESGSGSIQKIVELPLDGYGKMVVSEDEKTLVVPSGTDLCVVDIPSGKVMHRLPLVDKEKTCRGLLFFGERLYALFNDHFLVYDTKDYTQEDQVWLPEDNANQILTFPGGESFVIMCRAKIYRWDGKKLSLFEQAATSAGDYVKIAFDSAGKQMATTLSNRTVRIRSLDGSKPAVLMRGHQRTVNACLFLDDGATLVTTSSDRTIRFWDVATGRELGVLDSPRSGPEFLHYFAAENMLMSMFDDAPVKTWPANKVEADSVDHLSIDSPKGSERE